jgi:hypothetical protein
MVEISAMSWCNAFSPLVRKGESFSCSADGVKAFNVQRLAFKVQRLAFAFDVSRWMGVALERAKTVCPNAKR